MRDLYSRKKFLFLAVGILVLASAVWLFWLRFSPPPNRGRLESGLSRGIKFLKDHQLANGAFASDLCRTRQMKTCSLDSSPYLSTFVVTSLGFLDNPAIEPMKERTLNFLAQNSEPGWVWRFWAKDDPKHWLLPPDTDDTMTSRAVLFENNYQVPATEADLAEFRNDQGLYYLWLEKDPQKIPNPQHQNEVSCEVNANVLYYYSLRQERPQEVASLCQYLDQSILERKLDSCLLYNQFSRYPFFYLVTRAYRQGGASCLESSLNEIKAELLRGQRLDGSWGNDQDTALALISLLNLDDRGPEISRGLNYLIRRQGGDGGWARALFFYDCPGCNYWGSRELTTALSLEALSRYLKVITGS